MLCFNATPDFASTFNLQKSNGGGAFCIKYMEAAFDKENGAGEFFFEFGEKIWENKLVESFQRQGATQVTTITFAHNDGDESASNALTHVLEAQEKTGFKYTRGTRPNALDDKIKRKREPAFQEKLLDQEFKDKLQAAIEFSSKEVKGEILAVKEDVQAQTVKLESIEEGMQSHGVELVDIKQGVCNVIPDYQNEIRTLRQALEHKTKQCDVQEAKTAVQTGKVNQRDKEIAALHKREEVQLKREQSLVERIQELERALQICKAIEHLKEMTELAQEERTFARSERAELKQSIAEVQDSAKSLGSMLSHMEERACKRPREA